MYLPIGTNFLPILLMTVILLHSNIKFRLVEKLMSDICTTLKWPVIVKLTQ